MSFSPKRERADDDDGEPRHEPPRRPMLHRIIHRQCDRPRQTARRNVVESEQKNRARDQHAGIKRGRQDEDERCEPDQILWANAWRKNKEHQPRAGERIDECAAPSMTISPSDPNSSAHDDHFKNSHDKDLSGLKIKKRKAAKLTEPR